MKHVSNIVQAILEALENQISAADLRGGCESKLEFNKNESSYHSEKYTYIEACIGASMLLKTKLEQNQRNSVKKD